MIIGIEKKGKGISRMYAKVIADASEESFKPFFTDFTLTAKPILERMDDQPINLSWVNTQTSNKRKVKRKHRILMISTGLS